MTSYITITDAATDPSAPLTSELAKKWRDNPLAVSEKDTSVPTGLRLGYWLLGTINTTSGTSQTLSGLTLTNYTALVLEARDVNVNSPLSNFSLRLNSTTAPQISQNCRLNPCLWGAIMEYFEVITDASTGHQTIRPFTPEEISALAPTADDIRAQRNALLAESDWTQIADAPVNKTAWAAYRQELRDITEQAGFPTEVIWPTKPL